MASNIRLNLTAVGRAGVGRLRPESHRRDAQASVPPDLIPLLEPSTYAAARAESPLRGF